MQTALPDVITTESQLDEVLAIPYPALAAGMKTLPGDLIILGIAGKMGLSLGRTARRAIETADVRKKMQCRFHGRPEIRHHGFRRTNLNDDAFVKANLHKWLA